MALMLTVDIQFQRWRIWLVRLAIHAALPVLWLMVQAGIIEPESALERIEGWAVRFIVTGCKFR